MIERVWKKYLTANIENGEYSYPKGFRDAQLEFEPIGDNNRHSYEKLDIRFVKDNIFKVTNEYLFGKLWCPQGNNRWLLALLFGLITSGDILLRSITSTSFIISLGRIQTSFIVMVGGAFSLIVPLIFLPPNLNVGWSHGLIHSVTSKFSELFVEFTF